MIDTVESLFGTVRDLLGDTDIPGGDLFTNSEQGGALTTAWDDIVSMMAADQIPAMKRIWYHVVPANTTVLYPIQAGIEDLDSVVALDERPAGTSANISAMVAGTGNQIQVTTAAPHGLSGTPEVFISDLTYTDGLGANGRWFATVIDASNLLLRGSIFPATATYTSGGTVTTSTERFRPVTRVEELSQVQVGNTNLGTFCWREDAFQLNGATADVQVRITYLSDGSAPTTGSLIYDGIKNALAHRTAAILAYKHGRGQDDAARLDRDARGPELDGGGGYFFTFLQRKVRDLQKTPLYRPVRPPETLTDIYLPGE